MCRGCPKSGKGARCDLACLILFLTLATSAPAQRRTPVPSPAATPGATPTVIISATAAPLAAPAASSSPSASPSLLKKNGVKLEFLPPPMEGRISLGIYDGTGKLVRTLHREATGAEFVAALDGYITHWDGLDDAGKPMPPGHYSARGYMVGAVTVTAVPVASGSNASPAPSASPAASPVSLAAVPPGLKYPDGQPFTPQAKIRARLAPNPLDQDRSGSAELAAGIDAAGSWLQLSDGLTLKQISATPDLKWIAMGREKPSAPFLVFQGDGATVQEFQITKVFDMMAFNCGAFDFTGPANP